MHDSFCFHSHPSSILIACPSHFPSPSLAHLPFIHHTFHPHFTSSTTFIMSCSLPLTFPHTYTHALTGACLQSSSIAFIRLLLLILHHCIKLIQKSLSFHQLSHSHPRSSGSATGLPLVRSSSQSDAPVHAPRQAGRPLYQDSVRILDERTHASSSSSSFLSFSFLPHDHLVFLPSPQTLTSTRTAPSSSSSAKMRTCSRGIHCLCLAMKARRSECKKYRARGGNKKSNQIHFLSCNCFPLFLHFHESLVSEESELAFAFHLKNNND